ncbi:unnamed protein product [Bursaphelenchus okinawaensis]|uniref:FiLamiN (Actin binding protein) homolog n=1 Tax=Bursaphelenchus okinawaensis TaxID=465554 RepID=A0A811LSA5_9BILA|nr:unnamed protein product [Bursaphelenchus okinawaensis]CAG9127659.1 unnamed protein product [Bursaphelenchus okinawaensis]
MDSGYVSQLYVIPAVDAAEAGKGQLEISVNQGKVPNNVQMQDAGRCLVTFIPQHAGTYVIDVTFNGQQVHGCPIQVDVNSKHVGKPLSHAVHHKSGGVAVAGASSPAPSTIERGPSSAYFSGGSPQIDTSFQSPVSPLFQSQHSPRSPILVQRSSEGQYATGDQGLKSPRLVDLARADQAGRMGYTVAQYGEGQEGNSESYRTSRYFGDSTDRAEFKPTGRSDYSSPSRTDYGSPSRTEYTSPRRDYTSPSRTDYGTRTEYSTKHTEFTSKDRTEALRSPPHGDSTVDSGLGSTVTKHRYFESSDSRPHSTVEPEWRKSLIEQPPPVPKSPPPEESAQFQMTRSAEMKLYDDKLKTEDLTYKKGVGEEGYDYKVTSEKYKPGARSHVSEGHRQFSEGQQASPAPLGDVAPVSKYEPEVQRPSSRYESTVKYEVPPKDEFSATRHEARGEFSSAARQESAASRQEELPYKPESHRQYDEPPKDYDEPLKTEKSEAQPLQKATEIHGVPFEAAVERRPTTEYTPGHRRQPSGAQSTPATPGSQRRIEESGGESRSSSKPNTPRLSLKFGRDKSKDPNKGFEFGKSKFTSKHEIVRRGKDVDVKLENLKLSKEDQLRIVVLPPSSSKSEDPNAAPDLPHRVKKSGKTYEISFHPSEVGTHKVLAFVNDQPHPHSPFPIRVYDSSQIIVGEIVPQSFVNDTVEFTVDAGRAGFGNLEMAIKDNDDAIIPSHVNQLESGSAKFLVTFNPTSVGTHTVNITFNKEVIKGSPFAVQIVDPADGSAGDLSKTKDKSKQKKKDVKKDKTNGLPKLKDNKPVVNKLPSLSRVRESAHITVQIPQATDVVSAVVTDSTKEKLPVEVFEEELGLRRIEFVPQRVGDHDISVNVNGHEVNGSPFTCRAYDPSKIVVGVVPDGVVNKPVHFVVDASEGGVGNLEVAVNEGKIPSMAHPLGQHKYDISFVPRENVDHHVSVRFNNEPVPGSPFLCRLLSSLQVRAAGPGLERIAVGRETEFEITVDEPDTGKPLANPALPSVSVLDVKGNRIPVTVQKDPRSSEAGRFLSSYTPKVVGNHQIEVVYDNEPIPGSPFSVKAFDASCCRLILEEQAIVGKACTFLIDAAKAGAGNMEIIVSVDNKNVPNFVQPEGQARFKVFFTPQEVKDHVISVKFNSEPIPGSPLKCPVYAEKTLSYEPNYSVPPPVPSTPPPEQELKLVGDLRSAQIGRPKGFSIDSPHPGADCNVVITGPNGRRVSVELVRMDEGFDVEFTPKEEGQYEIDIQLSGKTVIVTQCTVEAAVATTSAIPDHVTCGEVLEFNVNLGKTNRNEIRIEVRSEDGTLVPSTSQLSTNNNNIHVCCTVHKPGRYSAIIYQNNQIIEEHFFNATPSNECVSFYAFNEKALVDQSAKFELEVAEGLDSHLHIEVTDPDGNSVPVSMHRKEGRSYEADWLPKREGLHVVSVLVKNQPVAGSPRQVNVLDLSTVQLIGLENSVVGTQQKFNLDWTNSGGSTASVKVTYNNKDMVPCQMKRLKHGLHSCTFIPSDPGLYLVDVYVDDVQLPECPYEVIVSDTNAVRARGDALTHAQKGKTARFEVVIGDGGRSDLDVVITDSTKSPLPVRCYKQQDQSYWVEFTPETIGEHIIEVTFADFPVNGSPFHCEVVDPKKVKVSGLDETIQQRHITRVLVDRTEAGKGQLDFEVSDPQGQELKVDRVRTAPEVDSFTFLPSKLGQHKVLINFAGFPVQGAKDFTVVEYGGAPKLEGPASQSVVEVDKTAKLWLESKNGGLKIDVRDQLGNKIRHQLAKAEHGATEISFVPANVGKYSVDVHLNNKALSEKPLEVTVVDPRKVVVNDETARADGTFVLGIGQKNIIDVDATAAGHGDLNVEVRDASGELLPAREARAESQGRGKHRLILQPSKKGALKIYLYYSGLPVPSAYPLMAVAETGGANVRRSSADQAKIYSTEAGRGYGSRGQSVEHTTHYSTSEARPHSTEQRTRSSTEYTTTHRTNVEQTKNFGASSDNIHHSLRTSADQTVRVHGEGLSRAIVKEPAEFIIDASQAPRAKITAQLIGEQNDIPVRLQEKSNNIYKAVYTPLAGGDYELIVKIDGKPLREQPFVVHVQSFTTPAGQIEVDTKNLKLGIINEDIKTVIDARKAGSGQLSAQCEGPTQLEYCELYDNRDGTYVLRVQPKELGRHVLSIKYANEHVPGSPFVFNVSNPPDASKVKVYGPGVEHGILATFKSNFVVETKGAGAGQLTVRVRGPKGAFNVEMQRDRQQDRTIHCKYEPKEPGDYQVEVKWHGQHVPGSPFMVMIVDTEQELQRFLAGEAPSPQPATPFVPPGWVGPPPPGMIPPPFSPALAASPYGPVPVGMIPPPHMRGRRSGPPAVMGPPQPIYGRRPY